MMIVASLALNGQTLPPLDRPDYLAFSVAPLYLSHISMLESIRLIGTIAGDKKAFSVYASRGLSGEKSEIEYGVEYSKHFSGYDINSFLLGVDISVLQYETRGAVLHSSAAVLQFGPRLGYTWHRQDWYLRPQFGMNVWLGVFGSVSESEYSSYPGSRSHVFPIIALMPDFQIEIGRTFQLGS